ncbi:MAG: universal stress protein [Thaumarchaeota archaeon]|nr:universal stress protein [Nitrososphaerota archaeon]
MFGHIMVPYDNSEPAKRALDLAVDLAGKYGSKISIVAHIPISFEYSSEASTHEETTDLLKKSASYSLSKLESRLTPLGIPHELAAIEGTSAIETLVTYAEMHQVDLIVMGSRGLGGFKKLLLGSVTGGMLQHSKCPVLIVK